MAFGQPQAADPYADMRAGFVNLPQHPVASAAAKPKINWLGVLADALSGAAGQTPLYTQSLMLQRQQAQQDARSQTESDRELQRQKDLYQFELANPKPANNDTANDYEFWQKNLSPDDFHTYIQNKINPPRYMEVPGVGLVQVPTAAPSAPARPVGKLTPIGAGGQTAAPSGGFH